ncbi:F0F1 ATP synthase assembly protein I [Sphingomonas koreensis]|nr:F0F1 ATP synthase assembly protein I [Sphingomonas koreensis]
MCFSSNPLFSQGRFRFVAHDIDPLPGSESAQSASLEERLRAARQAEAERTSPAGNFGVSGPGEKSGQRVISTLLGYPAGGGVIGWLLDNYVFHSAPWIMLALLFLGFAAACFQVFKISKERPE